jgi:hypothetical protein
MADQTTETAAPRGVLTNEATLRVSLVEETTETVDTISDVVQTLHLPWRTG